MIEDVKPYPSYRDSGLAWVGPVPSHWDLAPAKRALRSDNCGAVPVKNSAAQRPMPGYVPAFSASGQDVWLPRATHFGDGIVVSAVGARCGKSFRASGAWALVANTHALAVRSPHVRDYWWYVTNDELWWDRAGAAQPFVQVNKTLSRKVPIPPSDEQEAIVRFLDHANRRIDQFIRAKKRLIALLNEQKQAIIHRAVTRGLDPGVTLKDSGVDWTPTIPKHWGQYPLRRLARCENSGSYGHDPSPELLELPVATTAQIDRDGRFDVAKMPRRGFTAAEVGRFGCKPGDILVVKSSGSAANVISGKCGIVGAHTQLFVYSNFLARFVANESLVRPRYLFLLLTSHITRERVKRMVSTTTYPNLRMGEYRGALLPVPPLEEQQQILEAVGTEVASIDQASGRIEREIDLLREYRTRLIADVVTGQLDVRAAAASLPDVEPEAELTDTEGDEVDIDDGEAA